MKNLYNTTQLYLSLSIILGLLTNFSSKTLSATKYTEKDINAIARMATVIVSHWGKKDENEKCTAAGLIKDIDDRKRQIRTNQGSGGLIVAEKNNTYYILTNEHAIPPGADCYGVVVWDGSKKHETYIIEDANIEYIDRPRYGIDLALIKLEINSAGKYYIASLKNSDTISESSQLFISGWPKVEEKETSTTRRFISVQKINNWQTDNVNKCPTERGYKLCYIGETSGGMSGGPIFDANGYVVGIHGRGDKDDSKSQLGPQRAGIPINEFINLIDSGKSKDLTRDDLNFDPPSSELIAQGKINTKQADTIENLYELFLGCFTILQGEAECRKNPSPFAWNDRCS
ncbi:MAG: trypsin-like peptidase domain-containing protein [Sphaerospermopsis sp. SIO1G2]|nr:trypsin-like peptidase domain-containing protein [Sphaerospermopsis sp. SIO1G2]